VTRAGLRERWELATFGARHPRRRVAALAVLGTVTGAGEALIVLLLVAIASGGDSHRLPSIVPEGDTWVLAGVALGVLGLVALAHFASSWTAARAGADAQRSIQGMLVDSYLAAPYAVQRRSRAGELQNLIGSTRTVAMGTSDAARTVATAANLAIVVGAAVAVDVRATIALLAAVVLAIAIARAFRERTRRRSRANVDAIVALAAEVTETTDVAADLRVFGVTGRARERLGERLERSTRLAEEMQLAMGATPALTRDATIAVTVLGVAVLVTTVDIPLAVLGATVVLVMRALAHAQGLTSSFHRLAERAANVEHLRERLEEWRPKVPAGTRPCPRIGSVELRAVTFAHRPEEAAALRDVSLRLEPGEQLGVVGPTGAGKSTLAAIALGLLTPDSGEVLVDGVPLGLLDPADWHRLTAWVAQDPRLISGSVRDNIRFLRPHVGDAAVERAAHDAALAPDLASWDDGLDRDAGPAGAALSGGQRQRIALARALAGEPDLVVLDEPTSALDAHAEAAVRATLASLRGRATVIVIAHRLSTIRACDRLAVLREGRLVELGRPDEIAAAGSYLAEALALAAEGR
jgi:ABC-type multidrug transport system fused ATPase/permease subunit